MSTAYPPYPPGFGQRDVISRGTTGLLLLDTPTQTVIRWPENDRHWQGIQHERQVYELLEALNGHEGLLGYYGSVDTYGLRLEYMTYRDLQSHIRYKGINQPLELQWMIQVARVLEFIHRHGFIHGSVALHHIMLDAEGNAALADLAWCSKRDSGRLDANVAASHQYPGDRLTVQGDLFAFGSAMYELVTGMAPFVTLRDEDITARFARGVFPDVAALGALGAIISRCWTAAYENTKQVVDALEALLGPRLQARVRP